MKATGIALVAVVSVGGGALGALHGSSVASGEPPPLAPSAPVAAPETGADAAEPAGPGRSVAGIVNRRQDDLLLVRTRQGKLRVVHLQADTVVLQGRQRRAAADIREGDQITVIGMPNTKARPARLEARVIVFRRVQDGAPRAPRQRADGAAPPTETAAPPRPPRRQQP